MNNEKRQWNFFFSWVAGLAFGFEVMPDDRNEASFGIQLGIIRCYITREPVSSILGE